MLSKAASLHKLVNLWDVSEDGTLSGCSGEIGFLYELFPEQDASLMEEAGQGRFVLSVRHFLSALPAQCAAGFFVESELAQNPFLEDFRKRRADSRGAVREILDSRIRVMEGAPHRKTRYYLCLSWHPENFLKIPLFKRLFHPLGGGKSMRRFDGQRLEKLRHLEGLLAGSLSQTASLRRLGRGEALSFYWRRLNPSKSRVDMPPGPPRPFFSLRSHLALSPALREKEHFWMDGFYHKTLSLYTFGENIELGGMDRLIARLPAGSVLSLHLMAVDLEEALDRAKTQAKSSQGLAFLQGSKNYEAQAKARELDELVTLVRARGERLMVASLSLLLKGRRAERVEKNMEKARLLVREALSAETVTEDMEHHRLFFASLPFGAPFCPRRHTLTSEASACLAPLSAPWRGSSRAGMILQSREGEAVSLDFFEGNTPRHGIVLGSTGSGKSFAMNYLVSSLHTLGEDTRFVIVDVGGSYKRLCEALGGEYFEISLDRRYAINLFPAVEAILKTSGELDADLSGYLTLLIGRMLEGPLKQNRRRLIEKTVHRLYASRPSGSPLLGNFLQALDSLGGQEADRAEAREMLRELALFAEGSYAQVLNSPAAIQPFQGRLSVFDLAKLKEHRPLQKVLVSLIGFGLAQSMERRDLRKVIILDEGWEFFDDDSASELISRLYRTARKFNGLVVSVSQSPVDFLKSKASTAMLANAYWKMILRLDMGHGELPGLGLNARHVEAVRSLELKKGHYAELLAVFGQRARVLRLEPSRLEYWLATTNAAECAREAELLRKRNGKPRLEVLKELAAREPVRA